MDAPWNGERVKPVYRILALVFVLTAIITGVILLYFVASDSGQKWASGLSSISLGDILGICLYIYILSLFARVALIGRAPTGFLPWK